MTFNSKGISSGYFPPNPDAVRTADPQALVHLQTGGASRFYFAYSPTYKRERERTSCFISHTALVDYGELHLKTGNHLDIPALSIGRVFLCDEIRFDAWPPLARPVEIHGTELEGTCVPRC